MGHLDGLEFGNNYSVELSTEIGPPHAEQKQVESLGGNNQTVCQGCSRKKPLKVLNYQRSEYRKPTGFSDMSGFIRRKIWVMAEGR